MALQTTLISFLCIGFILTGKTDAAELSDAEALFRVGKYDDCAELAGRELQRGTFNSHWWELKIRSEAMRGKHDTAIQSLENALKEFPTDIGLRVLGYELLRSTGRSNDAQALLTEIGAIIAKAPEWTTQRERVASARFFLLAGADAKKILEHFIDTAIKENPNDAEAYFAAAELGLRKYDNRLAADMLQKAPPSVRTDPQYHFLLAKAFAPSDREKSAAALDAALKINPNHVESLLLRADQSIDAEQFDNARDMLNRVRTVDPLEPRAWAYQAVLAHLKADAQGERQAREKALTHWPEDPEVDSLIGLKLSQDYRFAEGAAYQRRALTMEPNYLPAKLQLCQDLLRLSKEDEGWKLAQEIFTEDSYNVVAYNLVTLRDSLAKFTTIIGDGFVLRMDPAEAELYGQRALDLLQRARKTLCAKYDVAIDGVVVVEIFPKQHDFAVRTFGVPGADGFLGVCFGRVITANSPASQGEAPSNWEAVLWHEFCHTVTLHKTHNKMPRWLSEGISVYEEMQQNPGWGQWLNPKYREMILGEELTPLSRLSSAFLAPKSALHLQFAYFESALAVEFLIEKFGFDAVKAVLTDLGNGLPINDALARHTAPLETLDAEFAKFARKRANDVAPTATWDKPKDMTFDELETWLKDHPNSFPGLLQHAALLVQNEKWAEAKPVLQKVKSLYPSYVAGDNAYALLATVYRNSNRPNEERAVLEELAERDADALPTFSRLIELHRDANNWHGVARNANRFLAANPLILAPHRALAEAADKLGRTAEAINAYKAMLQLGDPDLATIHYRTAELLCGQGKMDEARRHVLMALEEAPRYRDAHRLLLELVEAKSKGAILP